MSYGTAFVSPLPTPGVTPSPTFESQLIAWCQEAQGKLAQKVGVNNGDISLNGVALPIPHTLQQYEYPAAGASLLGCTYDATNLYILSAGATDTASFALPMPQGDTLRSIEMTGRNNGTAWTLAVLRINRASGVTGVVGTISSGVAAGTIETLSISVVEVSIQNVAYVARWTAGAAANRCLGVRLGIGAL